MRCGKFRRSFVKSVPESLCEAGVRGALTLWRLRHEDLEFIAFLGYMANTLSKIKRKKQNSIFVN